MLRTFTSRKTNRLLSNALVDFIMYMQHDDTE